MNANKSGLEWSLEWICSSKTFVGCAWPNMYTLLGAVHKWRHPLSGEGGSAKKWLYSIILYSKMGDKGEGGVKNLQKWVPSFMDGLRKRLGLITQPHLHKYLDTASYFFLMVYSWWEYVCHSMCVYVTFL